MAGPLTWELAEDLAAALGNVAVLTGHPDTLAKGSRPGLELHPSVPYVKGTMLRRVACWLQYSMHAFLWLWKWPRTTPILVFSNPPTGPWVACLLALLRRTPYAVMVHDIYPDIAERMGVLRHGSLTSRLWRFLNRRCYNRAALVMTLGKHMARVIGEQFDEHKSSPGAVVVMPPWADTEHIRPIHKSDNPFAQQHGQIGKLTVMYSGNMGIGHDIETMLAAAERLRPHRNIHFMFIGMGPKWDLAQQFMRDNQLDNITVLPWQDEDDLPYTLSTADVALVSLEEEMAGLAVPSKVFYSLAAGSAVIVICGRDSEVSDIVAHYDCGASVSPGDPHTLADVLLTLSLDRELLDRMKAHARAAAEESGNRRNAQAVVALLQKHGIGMGELETAVGCAQAGQEITSTPSPPVVPNDD